MSDNRMGSDATNLEFEQEGRNLVMDLARRAEEAERKLAVAVSALKAIQSPHCTVSGAQWVADKALREIEGEK